MVTMTWFLKFKKHGEHHSDNYTFQANTKDWCITDKDIVIEDWEKNGWELVEERLTSVSMYSKGE